MQALFVAAHQQREYGQHRLLNNRAAELLLRDRPAMAEIGDQFMNIHPVAFRDMMRVERDHHGMGFEFVQLRGWIQKFLQVHPILAFHYIEPKLAPVPGDTNAGNQVLQSGRA